jgi:hypothetical protein
MPSSNGASKADHSGHLSGKPNEHKLKTAKARHPQSGTPSLRSDTRDESGRPPKHHEERALMATTRIAPHSAPTQTFRTPLNDLFAALNHSPAVETPIVFAAHGIPVFPLQAGTRIPHEGSRGLKDGTTDSETVASQLAQHPE